MKIVNATWEKRNINVNSNEIIIGVNDTIETINNEILKYESEYTVIKVPTGQIDVLFHLQRMGFLFIETITTCYHSIEQFTLNKIQQRIINRTRYQEMNDDDVDFMFREIEKGLFTTDRISLDPYFSNEQSNNRYIYWIQDELKRGSRAFKIIYGERDAGFFTVKKINDNECFAFLGGIYSDFLNSGLGFCLYYYEVEEGKRMGVKRIKTTYSTNNRGALAVHLSMGCILDELFYVLIKHNFK